MVAVQRDPSPSRRRQTQLGRYLFVALLLCLGMAVFRSKEGRKTSAKTKPREVLLWTAPPFNSSQPQPELLAFPDSVYSSFSDLAQDEIRPVRGSRHMVQPPKGGRLFLVSCHTTKGDLSIVVHEEWAPRGAQRFLEMVASHFLTDVPLFRCIKNFLCQFGLPSDGSMSSYFQQTIADDKNWLPEGKEHRQNKAGVKRFAKGYLAYAGGGENSRNRQLIVSLANVGTLAGGSPWEVPFAEVVGGHSFETLSKIYTGYGDEGPKQGALMRQGMTDEMRTKFPKLDYLQGCRIVDRQVQEAGAF